MVEMNEIKTVAEKIGEAIRAERVILFGSYVRGTANQDSDVDLLVIAHSQLPRHHRSRPLYQMLTPYPFPMDLLVYTPQEVELAKASDASFLSGVLKEGRVVYERKFRDSKTVDGEGRE